jgi:hypothetical protein
LSISGERSGIDTLVREPPLERSDLRDFKGQESIQLGWKERLLPWLGTHFISRYLPASLAWKQFRLVLLSFFQDGDQGTGSLVLHRVCRHCIYLTRQLGLDSFMVNRLAGQGVDLYFCHRHRDVLYIAVQAKHQSTFIGVLHHLQAKSGV